MTQSMKQFEVLKWASLFLKKHHREPKVAELLLQHHLQVERSKFYMMMRDLVPPAVMTAFEKNVEKHALTGVPVQHLMGYETFYGRDFQVNEHVLIPRPETEELIEHILKTAGQQANESLTIADIGTGSGIIAITLALELPQATVYATDISEEALSVARKNAASLQADIHFLQGDFLKPLINKNIQADIIVSNPPYIAKSDETNLSDTVKNFDPALALFADDNGLAAYQNIISAMPKVIKENSVTAFEIGHEQGPAVASLLTTTFPNSTVEIIQDINGKDRIVSARM
ncbi:MAG TPA: peptide chain release factor N(5)-glutamine methyltransferase [Virgibacillus sp.]|nr:peptide chain release factor N(5)-glutamine methyltransferase [Virgibacillus sp.]